MRTVPRGTPRHRRRERATSGDGVPVEPPRVIAITDARTLRAHLVTDAAAAAGRLDGGRQVALCGTVVFATSLTTPETSQCSRCTYWYGHGVQLTPYLERRWFPWRRIARM